MEFPNDPVHFPNTVSGIGHDTTNNIDQVYKKPDVIFTEPLKPQKASLFPQQEIQAENMKLMNRLQNIQENRQTLILKDMMEKLEFEKEQEKISKLNAMLNNYYFTTFLDELQNKVNLSQNKRLNELQKEMHDSSQETHQLKENLLDENKKKSAEYWNLRQEGKTHNEILEMREKEKIKSLSSKTEEIQSETGKKVKQMMAEMIEKDISKEQEETEFLHELEMTLREEYEEQIEQLEDDKQEMEGEAISESKYMATFIDKEVNPFNRKLKPVLKNFDNQIDILERFNNIENKLSQGQSIDKILTKKMLNNLGELTNKIFDLDIEKLETESIKGSGSERRNYFREMQEDLQEVREEYNFDLEILKDGKADLEQLYLDKKATTQLKGFRKAQIQEEMEDRRRNLNDYQELYPFQFEKF